MLFFCSSWKYSTTVYSWSRILNKVDLLADLSASLMFVRSFHPIPASSRHKMGYVKRNRFGSHWLNSAEARSRSKLHLCDVIGHIHLQGESETINCCNWEHCCGKSKMYPLPLILGDLMLSERECRDGALFSVSACRA